MQFPKLEGTRIWLLLLLGVLLVLNMGNSTPAIKQAVANVTGKPCSIDSDCPCFGKYNYTSSGSTYITEAYGLGVATCNTGKCDTTYCVDVQPIGQWARDNPWAFVRDNPIVLGLILAAIAIVALWPKP